jgi:hypothetical protein
MWRKALWERLKNEVEIKYAYTNEYKNKPMGAILIVGTPRAKLIQEQHTLAGHRQLTRHHPTH